jgi:hypothetical protein
MSAARPSGSAQARARRGSTPRRALTVAGRSGHCGIGARRWIEPLADLSPVPRRPRGRRRPSRICCPPAAMSCRMTSDTPSAFAETAYEGLRHGTSGAGWDNVSWIGEWDIDLRHSAARSCCGTAATTASPSPRTDRSCQRIRPGRLPVRDGERHFGIRGYSSDRTRLWA